jgi:hypothetical protein
MNVNGSLGSGTIVRRTAKVKSVVNQSGSISTKGNAGIPNAGFNISTQFQAVTFRKKPWVTPWHPAHPANNQ